MAENEGGIGGDGFHLHPIFRNMRDQEIGKVFLNMMVAIFALAVYILFNSSDKNKTVFGFILLVLFAGEVAIYYGLLLRDTYPLLACILEQLGIYFVFLSIMALGASLLSVPALVIPVVCAASVVLVPFIIPFLNRQPIIQWSVDVMSDTSTMSGIISAIFGFVTRFTIVIMVTLGDHRIFK